MPCYHPMKAVKVDTDRYIYPRWVSIKNGIGFLPKECDQILIRNKMTGVVQPVTDFLYLPCGNCIGCRLSWSVERANRCIIETMEHENNWFITLTYDDEHLPYSEDGVASLNPADIKNFNKNLRRQLEYHFGFKEPLKIMYAGEYGEKEGHRPHYHGIYCGLPIVDQKLLFVNHNGDCIYTSDFLSKIWKKGFVTIGRADWQSCAYVARYVVKKHKGKDRFWYWENGVYPEFCVLSKGFGKAYFEKNKDKIYQNDKIIVPDKDGFRAFKPPRYFDKFFELDSPEDFEKLKQVRQDNAKEAMRVELSHTDLNVYDYLEVKERNFLIRVGALKRGLKGVYK